MGAWDRRYEKRVERELERSKTKGVLEQEPATRTSGHRATMIGLDPTTDRRALIPPLGLREYWYPALEAHKVGKNPRFWLMLGDELVFYRDESGEVVAVSDVCPHRGASLSEGDCFYKGFITCPYHGATFNGSGECVAFITEGTDSKMVGNLRVRRYPTRTLRGWVFVWMGAGEPAPIEDDVPPEFFEADSETMLFSTYTYWQSNWMVAIENHKDPHNTFFVHRNSVLQLRSGGGFRPTPLGPRSRLVNGRSLIGEESGNDRYYADENGKIPYQMYFEGVGGSWPLHRYRKLWAWAFKPFVRRGPRYQTPEEWGGGNHLPAYVRSIVGGHGMYTRIAIALKPNLCRVIYFHTMRRKTWWGRAIEWIAWHTYFNWLVNYNFSGQDNGATAPCRYFTEEHLSSTDSYLVMMRKLVTDLSRDAQRRNGLRRDERVSAETPAEEESYLHQRELGMDPALHVEAATASK
jgi:phenylpropionate dioxygenase-like ring-hydroxylating dioxygenase large terminal subunit